MQSALLRTFTVPGPWPAADPVVVARGASGKPGSEGKPVRVELRNLGGGTVAFADSGQDVIGQSGPSSKTYRLPAGETVVLVLAPTQKIYAVGDATGIMISVAVNEAFPFL